MLACERDVAESLHSFVADVDARLGHGRYDANVRDYRGGSLADDVRISKLALYCGAACGSRSHAYHRVCDVLRRPAVAWLRVQERSIRH